MFADNFHQNAKEYLLDEHLEELREYDEISALLSDEVFNIIMKLDDSIDQSTNPCSLTLEFQLELNEMRKRNQEILSFKVYNDNKILERGWKYLTLKFAE